MDAGVTCENYWVLVSARTCDIPLNTRQQFGIGKVMSGDGVTVNCNGQGLLSNGMPRKKVKCIDHGRQTLLTEGIGECSGKSETCNKYIIIHTNNKTWI